MNRSFPFRISDRPGLISLAAVLFMLQVILATGCQMPSAGSGLGKRGCRKCHAVRLDPAHDFKCTRCHRGRPDGWFKKEAHDGLVPHPAGPGYSRIFCAGCHEKQERSARGSFHYSLNKEITTIWQAFFPGQTPPAISEIHGEDKPSDRQALIRDLLARRCLRCHVYYRGDSYSGIRHGTGCAACHMDAGTRGHEIYRRPLERNCLSCHFANFTGWDYEGRFEKDYPEDFRAPLEKGRHIPRPYGIEWIAMQPDIHKRAGLTCLDCHGTTPFHPGRRDRSWGKTDPCIGCHLPDPAIVGHRPQDIPRAGCASCHAVWTVLDIGRNLMRLDGPDLEEWKFLSVQGSSEIERIVNEWADASLTPPDSVLSMTDKFTGQSVPGLWMAGFEQRRWGPVILGEDATGRLSVVRPILDLSVSYADRDGEAVFDSITTETGAKNKPSAVSRIVYPPRIETGPLPGMHAWQSYQPHTIGKADCFRTMFVTKFLEGRDTPED